MKTEEYKDGYLAGICEQIDTDAARLDEIYQDCMAITAPGHGNEGLDPDQLFKDILFDYAMDRINDRRKREGFYEYKRETNQKFDD